jgi:asparaginyl-tRNA synthetase
MLTSQIREILSLPADGRSITARGWVRTLRESKNVRFIELNDGSCFKGIQCVVDASGPLSAALSRVTTGASLCIRGRLVASPASGQAAELAVDSIDILGEAPAETYPLQKKHHSFEFLREIAHLRPRTNTFGAIARVRSQMAFAIHTYFQQHGFDYVHTPLITASDAEGAGAMFQVTTLDLNEVAKSGKPVDYTKDFFGKKAFLTVSGQLEGETYATALGRVYTFGPTFRAENSNTTRHLAEFWMIEPEVAFADITDNMDLAEDFLKFIFTWALEKCADDLAFFN